MKNDTNDNTELHIIRQMIGLTKDRGNSQVLYVDGMSEGTVAALKADGYSTSIRKSIIGKDYDNGYIIDWFNRVEA